MTAKKEGRDCTATTRYPDGMCTVCHEDHPSALDEALAVWRGFSQEWREWVLCDLECDNKANAECGCAQCQVFVAARRLLEAASART